MSDPDYIAKEFHRLEIDDDENVYSLKRALWANQTLLIKINDEARRTNRTLADIKYWVQFAGGGIFCILAFLWWNN